MSISRLGIRQLSVFEWIVTFFLIFVFLKDLNSISLLLINCSRGSNVSRQLLGVGISNLIDIFSHVPFFVRIMLHKRVENENTEFENGLQNSKK